LTQKEIAITIDQFFSEDSTLARCAKGYKNAMIHLDEEDRLELDQDYRSYILDPVGKLVRIFPNIHDNIAYRKKKLLDFDRVRSSVKKLVENPSADRSKLAGVY
jgi:hypothetical protein